MGDELIEERAGGKKHLLAPGQDYQAGPAGGRRGCIAFFWIKEESRLPARDGPVSAS